MTTLDFIVLAVIFLSMLLGAIRGFLRVTIGIIGCAAALLVTRLSAQVTTSEIGLGIIFVFALIIIFALVSAIAHDVLNRQIGKIDRVLGCIFGLPRGLIFVSLSFVLFVWLVPERSQPEWIRSANVRVLLQGTGDWLMSFMPTDAGKGLDILFSSFPALMINAVVLSTAVDFFAAIFRPSEDYD